MPKCRLWIAGFHGLEDRLRRALQEQEIRGLDGDKGDIRPVQKVQQVRQALTEDVRDGAALFGIFEYFGPAMYCQGFGFPAVPSGMRSAVVQEQADPRINLDVCELGGVAVGGHEKGRAIIGRSEAHQ